MNCAWVLVTRIALLIVLSGCTHSQKHASDDPAETIGRLLADGGRLYEEERYTESLDKFREALSSRAAEAQPRLGAALYRRIGSAELKLHQYGDAIESFGRGLQLARASEARLTEAVLLHDLGGAYKSRGETALSRQYLEQALPIRRELLDEPGEARTLAEIGSTYLDEGTYDEALVNYQHARAVAERQLPRGPEDLAAILGHIGSLYAMLGQYEEAVELHRRALQICMDANYTPGIASAYHNIGFVHSLKGEHHAAAQAFDRALVGRTKKDPLARAKTLNNLGLSLVEAKQVRDGLQELTEALSVFRELRNEKYVAATLDSIGTAQQSAGMHAKALDTYRQGLATSRRAADPETERVILGHLGLLYKDLESPGLAILHLKLAVNLSQQLRASVRALDPELRHSLTRRLEPSYRALSQLLIEQGRLLEAEQVLTLLKEHEHFEFIRRGQQSAPGNARVTLLPLEAALAATLKENADKLSAMHAEIEALSQLGQPSAEQLRRLETLKEGRSVEGGRLDRYLSMAERELTGESQVGLKSARSEAGELRTLLAKLHDSAGVRAAVVHLLPGAKVTTFLVVTKDGRFVVQRGPGQAELNELIEHLRTAIERRDPGYREPANRLYEALITPIEQHLENAQVTMLMLYLVGALRYVPFAALHNAAESKHLISKYALSVYTAAEKGSLNDQPRNRWSAAALGVSKPGSPWKPLAAVEKELKQIVRDPEDKGSTAILAGNRYINGEFTRNQLMSLMGDRTRHAVIHIATHFSLVAGSEEASSLLLGDGGGFKLREFRTNDGVRLGGYDLITLSGCETGLHSGSNGVEVESLGVTLQRQGAKSVLATLWRIDDVGAAEFMEQFYSARGEERKTSKAQALQKAQLAFLGRTVKSDNPGLDFTHPYFWAPFILLGNWM